MGTLCQPGSWPAVPCGPGSGRRRPCRSLGPESERPAAPPCHPGPRSPLDTPLGSPRGPVLPAGLLSPHTQKAGAPTSQLVPNKISVGGDTCWVGGGGVHVCWWPMWQRWLKPRVGGQNAEGAARRGLRAAPALCPADPRCPRRSGCGVVGARLGWGPLGSPLALQAGELTRVGVCSPSSRGGGGSKYGATGETQPRKWSLGRHVEVWLGAPGAQSRCGLKASVPPCLPARDIEGFLERARGEPHRPARARMGRGRRSASWGAKGAGGQPTRRQEPSVPGRQGQRRATEAGLQDPDVGVPKAQARPGWRCPGAGSSVGRAAGGCWPRPWDKASIQDFGPCWASMGIAQGRSTRRTSWRRDRGPDPQTYW